MNKIKITLVSAEGCACCGEAEEKLKQITNSYPQVEIEKIDMTSKKGQELVTEYQIMSSPGIIVNGELFSAGGLDKEELVEYIEHLD
ncbi:MAG: glutaredoxin family protein [Candidatus Magasanikbacteria bacterium]